MKTMIHKCFQKSVMKLKKKKKKMIRDIIDNLESSYDDSDEE